MDEDIKQCIEVVARQRAFRWSEVVDDLGLTGDPPDTPSTEDYNALRHAICRSIKRPEAVSFAKQYRQWIAHFCDDS